MLTKKLTSLGTAALTALAVLSTAAPAHADSPWFAPYVRTPVQNTLGPGPAPRATVTEDFDRDGHLDVATVTNFTFGNMVLERGNGDGTFGSPVSIPGTIQIQAIDSGDMNGDGNPDLVVMSVYYARVLLGDGTGHFSNGPLHPFALGTQVEPRVMDLDEDGDLDVVAPTFGAIQTLINNGAGSLKAGPVSIVPNGLTFSAISPAHLDPDSHADLFAVTGFSGTTVALRGTGTGRFTVSGTSYAGGFIAEDVVAVDLDDDGFDDAAVIGSFSFSLASSLTDGTGRFRKATPALIRFAGPGPTSISAADLDEDGHEDLILSFLLTTNPGMRVLAGNGTVQMREAGTYPVAALPQNPVLGDFDNDGQQDVVTVGPGSLSFLRNITS